MATHRSPARSMERTRAKARREAWRDPLAKRRTRRLAPAGANPSRGGGSAHEIATRILGETLAALILFLALLMSLRAIWAP
jgi:hypothetical protein